MGSAMWTEEPDTIKVSLVFNVDAYRRGTPAPRPRRRVSPLDEALASTAAPARPHRHAPMAVLATILVVLAMMFLPRSAGAAHASSPVLPAANAAASVATAEMRVAPPVESACAVPVPYRTVAPQ